MFIDVQCAEYDQFDFCCCLRFRTMRSLFFLVQLGPVLGTSISRKSGNIGFFFSTFSRIAPFLPGHFRE